MNFTPQKEAEEKRNRKKTSHDPVTCPVCGITLRETELEAHYRNELEKLTKIKKIISKSPQTSPSTSKTNIVNDESSAGSSKVEIVENCWGTYQKIKENRVRRTSKVKRKRKVEDRACPICFKVIVNEDIQLHVDLCLKKQENRTTSDESDDEIDVGETYSWCGQTRVRATTLFDGNLSSAGIGICVRSCENEDELVNIDGDDDTYGQSQYTERDIILVNKEDEKLHDLVATGSSESPSTSSVRENREENNQNVANSVSSSPTSFLEKMEVEYPKDESNDLPPNPQIVIESLKAKIREYESFIKNRPKCLICLCPEFEQPVVSISCWHVYCEKCWLSTLGAKKLCPQCSMITSATDLRRIYL